ncbi:MAG TPA: hypothetical protein ENG35_02320 [Desulfobacteraceae bacterium]|nr:hypothetical protein [Desulfobacteraceae bacterium]
MRQYVIDELRPVDYEKIKNYLNKNTLASGLDGLYWIALDNEILTAIQSSHVDCQPFYFAIDLTPNLVACELLVRTRSKIRCDCISYASELQRNWIIRYIDSIFDQLEIKT